MEPSRPKQAIWPYGRYSTCGLCAKKAGLNTPIIVIILNNLITINPSGPSNRAALTVDQPKIRILDRDSAWLACITADKRRSTKGFLAKPASHLLTHSNWKLATKGVMTALERSESLYR